MAEIAQHARAFVLGYHRTGRAANVEIDFLVPEILKLPRNREEGLCGIAQKLRHEFYAFVVLRQHIPQIARLEFSGAVRRDEGGIVMIRTGKHPGVHPPVYTVSDPLHGGKAQFHVFALFQLMHCRLLHYNIIDKGQKEKQKILFFVTAF